jgi:hypothetical protein
VVELGYIRLRPLSDSARHFSNIRQTRKGPYFHVSTRPIVKQESALLRPTGRAQKVRPFSFQLVTPFLLNPRPESDIMATIAVDGSDLVVQLSALEKIGAMGGDIRVPLASVRAVRVSDTPWSELRGFRAPGTGVPGVISLCRRRGLGVHDFAAVYGRRPALVVEMTGASFDRLVVSCADAAEAAARAADITRASGLAHVPR